MKGNIKGTGRLGVLEFDTRKGRIKSETLIKGPKVLNAVIYCRVSDKQQVVNGHGLEGQERTCIDWCERQSPPINVSFVFKEPGVSGANINRKELNNAIAYIKQINKTQNKISHFVVSEASRICRPDSIVEAFTLEDRIKALGVQIVKVDNPGLDDSTDEGELYKTIEYAIAGYYRKKTGQRVFLSRKSRLLNGYWPFPSPPLGYVRERLGPKNYIDKVEEPYGSLIKEGLELFARDIIGTQSQLRDYRNKKGLRTKSKRKNGLQRTFPEKVFALNRLFFYAGLIIFPKWGIEEPVEGKHEGLISIPTLYKIIEKLKRDSKQKGKKRSMGLRMSKEHPLRGVITCQFCKRKFTSWNTTKRIGAKGLKEKKLYPYYGCNNIDCGEKVIVKKADLELEFESLIKSLQLHPKLLLLLDKIFEIHWKSLKKNYGTIFEKKTHMINDIKQRMKSIEDSILNTTNIKLQAKYEEAWSTLDNELELLESDLSNRSASEVRMKTLIDKSKSLIQDPVAIWNFGSQSLRELLLSVRFGDSLYYSKSMGLQTNQRGNLMGVMKRLDGKESRIWVKRETDKTASFKFLEAYIGYLNEKSREIEAAHSKIEYFGVLDSKK